MQKRPTIRTDTTLDESLQTIIAAYPDRPALSLEATTISYREFGRRTGRLAALLRREGVRQGDRVAVILPNGLEYACAYFALPALGAVIVPLSPRLKAGDYGHILADAQCAAAIVPPPGWGGGVHATIQALRSSLPGLRTILTREEIAAEMASPGSENADPSGRTDRSPDEPYAMIYTSGTTGEPKAVVHSHRTMLSGMVKSLNFFTRPKRELLLEVLKIAAVHGPGMLGRAFRPMVVLSPGPLFHLSGYGAMLASLIYGFRYITMEDFHPGRTLQIVRQERVNLLMLNPTTAMAILGSREIGRRFRSQLFVISIGAAYCPPDLVRRMSRTFHCPVYIVYGSTELGGTTFSTSILHPLRKREETIGRPFVPGGMRIVDEQHREVPPGVVGEIAHKLPGNMVRYHGAPDATARVLDGAGWLYTGDLGVRDERGYVRIVGRVKDVIIRGGAKIYPAEMEGVLLGRPGVANAAAIGMPHPVLGEAVWICLEPEPGHSWTPEEVHTLYREKTAAAKRPDRVIIMENIPTTENGKPQKHLLKKRLEAEASAGPNRGGSLP